MSETEKQLSEALAPFVTVFHAMRRKAERRSASAGAYFDKWDDRSPVNVTLTMGDFRRAEKAIEELRKAIL